MAQKRDATKSLGSTERGVSGRMTDVLESFSPGDRDTRTVRIAPFIILGKSYTSWPSLQLLRASLLFGSKLPYPLVEPHPVTKVAINKIVDGEVEVGGANDRLQFILIGKPVKALPLGETALGTQAYLTPQGYLGESVPSTPDAKRGRFGVNEHPVRAYDSVSDQKKVWGWQYSDFFYHSSDEPQLLPVVSVYTNQHLSKFPQQTSHVLEFLLDRCPPGQ